MDPLSKVISELLNQQSPTPVLPQHSTGGTADVLNKYTEQQRFSQIIPEQQLQQMEAAKKAAEVKQQMASRLVRKKMAERGITPPASFGSHGEPSEFQPFPVGPDIVQRELPLNLQAAGEAVKQTAGEVLRGETARDVARAIPPAIKETGQALQRGLEYMGKAADVGLEKANKAIAFPYKLLLDVVASHHTEEEKEKVALNLSMVSPTAPLKGATLILKGLHAAPAFVTPLLAGWMYNRRLTSMDAMIRNARNGMLDTNKVLESIKGRAGPEIGIVIDGLIKTNNVVLDEEKLRRGTIDLKPVTKMTDVNKLQEYIDEVYVKNLLPEMTQVPDPHFQKTSDLARLLGKEPPNYQEAIHSLQVNMKNPGTNFPPFYGASSANYHYPEAFASRGIGHTRYNFLKHIDPQDPAKTVKSLKMQEDQADRGSMLGEVEAMERDYEQGRPATYTPMAEAGFKESGEPSHYRWANYTPSFKPEVRRPLIDQATGKQAIDSITKKKLEEVDVPAQLSWKVPFLQKAEAERRQAVDLIEKALETDQDSILTPTGHTATIIQTGTVIQATGNHRYTHALKEALFALESTTNIDTYYKIPDMLDTTTGRNLDILGKELGNTLFHDNIIYKLGEDCRITKNIIFEDMETIAMRKAIDLVENYKREQMSPGMFEGLVKNVHLYISRIATYGDTDIGSYKIPDKYDALGVLKPGLEDAVGNLVEQMYIVKKNLQKKYDADVLLEKMKNTMKNYVCDLMELPRDSSLNKVRERAETLPQVMELNDPILDARKSINEELNTIFGRNKEDWTIGLWAQFFENTVKYHFPGSASEKKIESLRKIGNKAQRVVWNSNVIKNDAWSAAAHYVAENISHGKYSYSFIEHVLTSPGAYLNNRKKLEDDTRRIVSIYLDNDEQPTEEQLKTMCNLLEKYVNSYGKARDLSKRVKSNICKLTQSTYSQVLQDITGRHKDRQESIRILLDKFYPINWDVPRNTEEFLPLNEHGKNLKPIYTGIYERVIFDTYKKIFGSPVKYKDENRLEWYFWRIPDWMKEQYKNKTLKLPLFGRREGQLGTV